MTKRMLIDATHAEETRVVVLDGTRLDEFDVETSTKRQIKSNIYLAKVVRVEPSLQAAFVEYGGNRHGFLAFGEIHPDYYQIPVADRQRLLELQAQEAAEEEAAEERAAAADASRDDGSFEAPFAPRDASPEMDAEHFPEPEAVLADAAGAKTESAETGGAEGGEAPELHEVGAASAAQPAAILQDRVIAPEPMPEDSVPLAVTDVPDDTTPRAPAADEPVPDEPVTVATAIPDDQASGEAHDAIHVAKEQPPAHDMGDDDVETSADLLPEPPPVESLGGADDPSDDAGRRRTASRALRSYKIQEVIKRRQILLVQVVKEERGGKGAALSTYISLAGRYCVLMPNSPRGGGVSRKITSVADRRRLKEVTAELDLPKGMGLIVRTAGAARPKPEIMRDCEYLLRLWDDVRELTLKSVAPSLIYEEASLIKRAIRDVYSRDVEEVLVDGEDGWRAARTFMSTLIPSHARKVQLWSDPGQKLFAKYQVDKQLDDMLLPTVQLRSGGYLVINQTEALVAIDVNSGRSTRERGIEETALRTNMEAADEVARQLRLRDLAGLIVIDFIDMESRRNNASVERRLKDALKLDRARIQLGTISHFGLMEMSRQRLRPSLAETSFQACPHCAGTGLVRSTENAAIHVLRAIETEGANRQTAELCVRVATSIALYLLNNKRDRLADIEARYGMRVIFAGDDSLIPPELRMDRVRPLLPGEAPRVLPIVPVSLPVEAPALDLDVEADDEEEEVAPPGETAEEGEQRRRRRRRRRRGGRRDEGAQGETSGDAPDGDARDHGGEAVASDVSAEADLPMSEHIEGVPERLEEPDGAPAEPTEPAVTDGDDRRPRRGRRGGRRRRRDDEVSPEISAPGAEQPDIPVYVGPTPANPFGGVTFDIFDVMERAEQTAALTASLPEAALESVPKPAEEATSEPIALPEPEPEPVVTGQAVVPTVIDEGTAPAERKRGWWRR